VSLVNKKLFAYTFVISTKDNRRNSSGQKLSYQKCTDTIFYHCLQPFVIKAVQPTGYFVLTSMGMYTPFGIPAYMHTRLRTGIGVQTLGVCNREVAIKSFAIPERVCIYPTGPGGFARDGCVWGLSGVYVCM
jgi:hypothetical protein